LEDEAMEDNEEEEEEEEEEEPEGEDLASQSEDEEASIEFKPVAKMHSAKVSVSVRKIYFTSWQALIRIQPAAPKAPIGPIAKEKLMLNGTRMKTTGRSNGPRVIMKPAAKKSGSDERQVISIHCSVL
jgi:hypothetical protein